MLDERIFFFGWKVAEGKDYRQRKIFTDIEYRHKFRFMPVFDIETQDKKPRRGTVKGVGGNEGVLHTREAEENPRYSRLSDPAEESGEPRRPERR